MNKHTVVANVHSQASGSWCNTVEHGVILRAERVATWRGAIDAPVVSRTATTFVAVSAIAAAFTAASVVVKGRRGLLCSGSTSHVVADGLLRSVSVLTSTVNPGLGLRVVAACALPIALLVVPLACCVALLYTTSWHGT